MPLNDVKRTRDWEGDSTSLELRARFAVGAFRYRRRMLWHDHSWRRQLEHWTTPPNRGSQLLNSRTSPEVGHEHNALTLNMSYLLPTMTSGTGQGRTARKSGWSRPSLAYVFFFRVSAKDGSLLASSRTHTLTLAFRWQHDIGRPQSNRIRSHAFLCPR